MTDIKILDNMLEYYVNLSDSDRDVYLDVLEENDDLYNDFMDYYFEYELIEEV